MASFVCRLITANNLRVDKNDLSIIVPYLTDIPRNSLTIRDHTEREQAWFDLIISGYLPQNNSLDAMLKSALDSQCYRVVQHIYEASQDYSNMLMCYLKDDTRKSEVFAYILTYIDVEERRIREQFLVNFKELIKTNKKNATDIVIEHFPNLLQELFLMIEGEEILEYDFVNELIGNDVKTPPHMAERYLEILCTKDRKSVPNFVRMGLCRVEEALKITKRYEMNLATALLLEKKGEWDAALNLLLENGDVGVEAIELCIRGSEHLNTSEAQQLWLKLLKECGNSGGHISIRQLLHAAAPHVAPAQLLELVSDARFRDVKTLLMGMLSDYEHDVQMLSTTLRLVGEDLHQGKFI